jgi:hypothetical protein
MDRWTVLVLLTFMEVHPDGVAIRKRSSQRGRLERASGGEMTLDSNKNLNTTVSLRKRKSKDTGPT